MSILADHCFQVAPASTGQSPAFVGRHPGATPLRNQPDTRKEVVRGTVLGLWPTASLPLR